MAGNALAKLRSFLVRGLAVAAVLLTWAVGTVGTQIAGALGVSSLMLATTATPAEAQRRRFRRRGYYRRGGFRRRRAYYPRRRFVRRRRVIRRRGWGW